MRGRVRESILSPADMVSSATGRCGKEQVDKMSLIHSLTHI